MKNLKITYFLMVLLAFGIFSCGSDDEPGPAGDNADLIDIEDDNAVSKALTFENGEATVVEEAALPASSTDADAPRLEPDDEDSNLLAISGGKLSLDIDEMMGANLKGAYVQIDGADHYYDIAFDGTSSNGRTFMARKSRTAGSAASARVQSVESLLLTLPAGLQEGSFCLTYAVYDDQNRVSNAVEVCVEVKSSGGAESNFLTDNEWAMVAQYWSWTETDGETGYDTTIVGELWEEHYEVERYCSDTVSKSFPAVYKYTLSYSYASFSTDGTIIMKSEETWRDVDYEQTTCEAGVVYEEEETETSEYSGSWAYDADKKELTLVIAYTDTWEEAVQNPDGTTGPVETMTETHVETEVYQVSYENGKLTLTMEETFDENSDGIMETETGIIIFEPKK